MGGPCFQSVWLVLRIAAGRCALLKGAQLRGLAAGIESALGHYLCAPGAVFTPTGTYCHSQKRIGWWWQWLGTLRLVSEQGLSLRHPHFVNPSRKEHLHLTPCLLASHLPPPPVPLNFKHHHIPWEAWSPACGFCQAVPTDEDQFPWRTSAHKHCAPRRALHLWPPSPVALRPSLGVCRAIFMMPGSLFPQLQVSAPDHGLWACTSSSDFENLSPIVSALSLLLPVPNMMQ